MAGTIVFHCEGCGKLYQVDTALAGKKAACKQCKLQFRVPMPDGSDAAPLPPRRPKPAADDLADFVPKRGAIARSAGASKWPPSPRTLAIGIPLGAIAFAVAYALAYKAMSGAKVRDVVGNLVSSVSGETEHDRVTKGMIGLIDEAAEQMKGIETPADAIAASGKLDDIRTRIAQAQRKGRDLPKPSESEFSRLESTYKDEIAAAKGRLAEQIRRLQSIGGIPGPLLAGFPSTPDGTARPFVAPGFPGPPPGFPGPPPGFHAPAPSPSGRPTTPADSITLNVSNVADSGQADWIGEQIGEIHAKIAGGNRSTFTTGSGNSRTWTVTPVSNPKAFADLIKFGRVTNVRDRAIDVVANPLSPELRRPPDSDFIGQALFDLKSSNQFRRRTAASRLADTIPVDRREEVAKALASAIGDADPSIRREACKALGAWGSATEVPLLVARIADQDHGVREEAIKSLGRRKDARGARAVTDAFPQHRSSARDALVQIGPEAEEAVASLLKSDDLFIRTEGCKILGDIGGEKSLPPLQFLARRQGIDSEAARQAIKSIRATMAEGDSKPSTGEVATEPGSPTRKAPVSGQSKPALPKGRRLRGQAP